MRTQSAIPQVMRLHRAVPKIPTKSSVLRRLLLHKSLSVETPSKSTHPQLLIPLHFKSCINSAYKKCLEEALTPAPKVCNLSLPARRSCVHAGIPATPFPSMLYFINSGHPRVGGIRQSSPRNLKAHRSPRPRASAFTPSRSGRYLFLSCLSTFNFRLSTSRHHLFRTPNEVK